jgi:hypothetical protein
MKIIINESQLRLIIENEDNDNLINFTPFYKGGIPPEEWDDMFLLLKEKKERKGDKNYTGYYIDGDVYLPLSDITELNYLVRVGGYLDIGGSKIKILPMLSYVGDGLDLMSSQIKLLPMLSEVGGVLTLYRSQIESLPMLSYVGGFLDIRNTPLSKTTTEKKLRNKIEVNGYIYL